MAGRAARPLRPQRGFVKQSQSGLLCLLACGPFLAERVPFFFFFFRRKRAFGEAENPAAIPAVGSRREEGALGNLLRVALTEQG